MKSFEPFIGCGIGAQASMSGSPSVLGLAQGGSKRIGSGESVGAGATGVRTKTRCIPLISHVAQYQTMGWITS